MIAKLHIQTKLRNNFTVLKEVYCTPPFKIANISENKKDQTLQLMLMSSSPGILDDDDYRININLEQGCSLNLHTQSYQRLFTMKDGASQTFEVNLDCNSSFCYLPHPTVPHESSNFTSINKVFLSANCTLIWGEVLTCGRKLNGEIFQFSKFHNLTEIFLNKKLIIKENLLLQPKKININAIGQLENYTHQASLIYLDEKTEVKSLIQTINMFLSTQLQITFGITATQKNGLMVRILGFKAEQLHNCLIQISNLIALTKLS